MSVVSDSGKTHHEEKIALGRIRAENFGSESHGDEKNFDEMLLVLPFDRVQRVFMIESRSTS